MSKPYSLARSQAESVDDRIVRLIAPESWRNGRFQSSRNLVFFLGDFTVGALTLDGQRIVRGTHAATNLGARVTGTGTITVVTTQSKGAAITVR
jgi:hypothetical protein